jgi:hypothetical protein
MKVFFSCLQNDEIKSLLSKSEDKNLAFTALLFFS